MNEINNIKNGTITEMNIIKKRIIDKSVLEFNNINYLMKDKTLNEINHIKNGTITKIKNVKK